MRTACSLLLFGLLGLAPSAVNAEVTITDWRGASVTVTEGSVDSSGEKVVYHTAGDGPLVSFVHSITGPWFDFRHQMVALSERYRVVSMSTRGTDKSDKPAGVEHYTSAKIAGDIDAIIRHFGADKARPPTRACRLQDTPSGRAGERDLCAIEFLLANR